MAAPTVGEKYLVTFFGTLCGQTILSTFWYQLVGAGTAISVVEVEDDLVSALNAVGGLTPKFLDTMADNYLLEEIWVQVIHPTRLMKSRYPQGIGGTSGIPSTTANVSYNIERRGEVANRRSVGGLRAPVPDDALILTDGVVTDAAYKTAMATLATQMKANITTPVKNCQLVPVIFNPRDAVVLPRTIVQCTPFFTVRTMHRRTVGLGI